MKMLHIFKDDSSILKFDPQEFNMVVRTLEDGSISVRFKRRKNQPYWNKPMVIDKRTES